MEIAFKALIKSITNKSLVSGDKMTRIILDFDSSEKTEILNSLNTLQQADKQVMIVIMDEKK